MILPELSAPYARHTETLMFGHAFMHDAPAGAPLNPRRFAPLFWTQFFGAFNDNFFKSAFLTLAVFFPDEFGVQGVSGAAFGSLASGVFIFPFFLFSASAGEAADAFDKAKVARISKTASCAVAVLGAAALLTHNAPLLLGVLFLNGAQSAVFGPVKYALLPQHLPEHELMTANAKIESATFLAILTGAMAGGATAGTGAMAPALCASVFGVVAICSRIASGLIPPAPPAPDAEKPVLHPFFASVRLSRSLKSETEAVRFIPHISWFWALGAAFLSQFPALAKETYGAGTETVTLFQGLFSAGVGIGSAVCGVYLKGKPSAKISSWALLTCGAFASAFCLLSMAAPKTEAAGILPFLNDPVRLLAALCLTGTAAAGGAFVVPLYTVMQDLSSPPKRARVIAANNIVNALFMAGTAVTLPALYAAGFTAPSALLLLSAGCLPAAWACRLLTDGH